jgi:hypothetical protein
LPLPLRNDSVNVVVQLAGDPVSVRETKANRKLSNAEKEEIKGQLKRRSHSCTQASRAWAGSS